MKFDLEKNKLAALNNSELENTSGGMDVLDWFDKSYKEMKGAIIDAYNDAMNSYNASH